MNKNKKLEPILKRLVNEAQTRETRSLTSPDPKPIGPVMKRVLADLEAYSDPKEIVYQHTVLCQTVMPYRNPGDAVRLWQRSQGRAHLEIQAGRAFDPTVEDFVDVGLPFGPKPRLMLYHLNAQAVKTRSPEIEVEDSLTAFVKRLGLAAHGRNIRMIKDQLSRLSASDFRIGTMCDGRAITIKASIVTGFELWAPKDSNQRVLWPSYVRFSQEYFESLMRHAVPLNEAAIANLSHTAMGLDIYTWLAQRLHRIPDRRIDFVPWPQLQEQFGQNFTRLHKFREKFIVTLKQVHMVYSEARIDVDGCGLTMQRSRPPIPRRLLPVK